MGEYFKYGLYVGDTFLGYTNTKEKIMETISRLMSKALEESSTVSFTVSNVSGINLAGTRRL